MYKYKPQDVIAEADLFLSGHTLVNISNKLDIPVSTVSWHLIYKLEQIDPEKWVNVRKYLNKFAKNKIRAEKVKYLIEFYENCLVKKGSGV